MSSRKIITQEQLCSLYFHNQKRSHYVSLQGWLIFLHDHCIQNILQLQMKMLTSTEMIIPDFFQASQKLLQITYKLIKEIQHPHFPLVFVFFVCLFCLPVLRHPCNHLHQHHLGTMTKCSFTSLHFCLGILASKAVV